MSEQLQEWEKNGGGGANEMKCPFFYNPIFPVFRRLKLPTEGRLQPVQTRHTPQLSVKTRGGGGGGGGGGGPARGRGGGPAGGRGGSIRGLGGGFLPGVGGGVWPGVRGGVPPRVKGGGRLGLGLGLTLGSPSWWNQSWFYNPF